MRHFISGICCLIVGLQMLIGVPLIVCVAFHGLVVNELGPVSVVYQPGDTSSPVTIPPPNRIPTAADEVANHPILQTRDERGSPLAGTVLECDSLEDEQGLFVAAVEKAAAERASEPTDSRAIEPTQPAPAVDRREQANQFAISQLYAMAEMDEQAAQFERADQWRALAREIRNLADTTQTTNSAATEALSRRSDAGDLPF